MFSQTAKRNALLCVFVTILLDTIGFGIVAPVLPELLMELSGEGLASTAKYGGWLLFVYALMQFLFAPIIGNLSDRYGRRPTLLLSLLAFAFDYVLMGLAPSLTWLFIGRCLCGIAGATSSTTNAYVADISSPEERAKNFGLLGAAWGLGVVIGPSVGGVLGEYGARVPFFAAALVAFLNLIYGFFVLPETLKPGKRRSFSLVRANPVGALIQMRRYPMVLGIFAVLIFYQLAHDANASVWSFYTMLKFEWSELDVGYSLAFVGVMSILVQGSLIRSLMPRIGERNAIYGGFVLMALGFLGFAYAPRGWMMYLFIVPFTLGGLANPALRSILSKQVPEDAQGELQGAITSLNSLTAIVAPLLMTQLFSYFTSERAAFYFPGAAFAAAALLMLVSLVLFRRVIAPGARRNAPQAAAAIAPPPLAPQTRRLRRA